MGYLLGRPLSIVDLIAACDIDAIRVQNIEESMSNIRVDKRHKTSTITFCTDANFLNPTHVATNERPYVGLVVWLPSADVKNIRERLAHTEGTVMDKTVNVGQDVILVVDRVTQAALVTAVTPGGDREQLDLAVVNPDGTVVFPQHVKHADDTLEGEIVYWRLRTEHPRRDERTGE